jgi:hypothetical protein
MLSDAITGAYKEGSSDRLLPVDDGLIAFERG